MSLIRFISLFLLCFSITSTYSQQIDFKEFVKADSNIVNRNTIFNWYWSSVLNKQMKIRRIREFKVTKKDTNFDTTKINTISFDHEGRIKRWNTVAFRYSGNGSYLGFVDTIKSEAILPVDLNKDAFVEYNYYTEKRDNQTNLLKNTMLVSTPKSDTLNVVYEYNPLLFTKGQETEINGNLFVLPDGPACYLQSIKLFKASDLILERFLIYEYYDE